MRSTNTSGVTGVYNLETRVLGVVYINKKRVEKYFSDKHYGEREVAFSAAVRWRKAKDIEKVVQEAKSYREPAL